MRSLLLVSAGLVPIQEADQSALDANKLDTRMDGQTMGSRGGRSVVHFSLGVTPELEQSPATPNESEPGVSVAESPTPNMDASMMVHYSEHSDNEYAGLMVIGVGAQLQGALHHGPMEMPEFPPTKVPTATPSVSPEPWPQVDEEAYRMMSSPTQATKSVVTVLSRNESAPVRLPTSAGALSTESMHSEKLKKRWQGDETESPGPPPPSPEPADVDAAPPLMPGLITPHPLSANGSALAILKEETSESEALTISAQPPSNLDDISRINTPNSYASRGFYTREATATDNMAMLVETSHAELTAAPAEDMTTPGETSIHTELAMNQEVSEEPSAEVTARTTSQLEDALVAAANDLTANGSALEATQAESKLPPEQMLDVFDATQKQFEEELKTEYQKLSDPEQSKADS